MNEAEIQSLQVMAVLLLVWAWIAQGIVGIVFLCVGLLLCLVGCYNTKADTYVDRGSEEEEIPLTNITDLEL